MPGAALLGADELIVGGAPAVSAALRTAPAAASGGRNGSHAETHRPAKAGTASARTNCSPTNIKPAMRERQQQYWAR